MKKFIALFLTLLMILTSANISFAAAAEETIIGQPGTIKTWEVKNSEIYTDDGKYIGFMNFDFTNYLPMLYLADSVTLTVKSASFSASNDNKFSLEIIPDSAEIYTDFTGSDYYSHAVAGGILSDGIEILSATTIGSKDYASGNHSTDDIKAQLIEALESGKNHKISIRLVLAENVESSNVSILTNPEMTIEYDDAVVSDEAYYKTILGSFNLEEKANIDLDNITSDFILPTYFKGSNITWTSDKANIAVSTDGTASVTKPMDNDEQVTLTATLSYKDGSSYQTSFKANVVKKAELEKLEESFNSTYKVSDEDYSAITKDLNLNKTFEGATLSWVSSNEDVVKAETGRVIRQESGDVQVALTPTISYGGESIILNPVNVTVKKITPATSLVSFASAGMIAKSEVNPNGQPLTYPLTGTGTDRFGVLNFDLTSCLPQLYLANTVIFKFKSAAITATKLYPVAIEIIPDSKEIHTDFNGDTYDTAVAGGVLSDGTQIYYADAIGYNNTLHTTSDIKDVLIKALESGDNNNISLRLVAVNGEVKLQRYGELEFKYDSSLATDNAYYEKISKDFDLETIANIDLASVKSDFTLPTFFKGSNITWTSGNANVISVSSDGTAKVTRLASGDETVTLTAAFSYKDGSSYEKTFEANVPEINVPVIEAVKNNDGTFSAVIKSNEAVNENYTLYFASYTSDNTLVGLYGSFVNALNEGTTRVDADAEEFLTNGATKIKCILLKGDTLTPACKNGEVPN